MPRLIAQLRSLSPEAQQELDFGPDSLEVKQELGFGTDSKAALKAISSKHRWDGGRNTWIYPYTPGNLQGLVDAASVLGFRLDMDQALREQLTRVQAETEHEHSVRKLIQTFLDDRKLPIAPYTTQPIPPPWRHQQVAWHWAVRVRCLYLALKPGLGKTRTGADIIRGKHELGQIRAPEHFALPDRYSAAIKGKVLSTRWAVRGGVLVVCPRVVIGEWVEQLQRWQNIKGVAIVGDADRKRYRAGLKSWVHICSYDSLESVEGNEYDGIIGDELHFIANEDSNRWNRMQALRQHASWVIGMSGTPIPNMLPSLWAQYFWLDGGRTLGPTYDAYRRKYFTQNGRKLDENDTAEARISQAISRITMFMTMAEAFPDRDVQKIQQVIRIPMTREQVNYYELVRKESAAEIISGRVTMTEVTTRLLKLLQITQGFVLDDEKVVQQFSSAKLKALEDMLTGSGDLTDKRTIVWCRFKHDLKMVSDMLTRKGIKHLTFGGGMSDGAKEKTKDQWNNDHTHRVFVGMIQMGIGINLHAPTCVDDKGKPARCSTTVFYGYDWRVTQLEQAMDRVYRGDQVETCLYRYLLSDDLDTADENGEPMKPIDVRIYESLQDKLNQVTRVNEESVDYIRRLLAA
jgi:hypothetical protein